MISILLMFELIHMNKTRNHMKDMMWAFEHNPILVYA